MNHQIEMNLGVFMRHRRGLFAAYGPLSLVLAGLILLAGCGSPSGSQPLPGAASASPTRAAASSPAGGSSPVASSSSPVAAGGQSSSGVTACPPSGSATRLD